MADDAILRETKASIDRLFAQVSGGAGSASKGLYDVGSASRTAAGGLSSLSTGTEGATRAASGFVSAVGRVESAVSGSAVSMTAAAAKLKDDLGGTVSTITDEIDDKAGHIGTALSGVVLTLRAFTKGGAALVTGATGGAAGLKDKIGKAMTSVGSALPKGIGKILKTLSPIGIAMGTLYEYLDDSYKSFKYLSKSGITLGGDLRQVGALAGRSMLSFQELSTALSYASPALANFGGMADFGAKTLVTMQENILDSVKTNDNSTMSFGESVRMMGIEGTESMKLITEMMGDQVFATKLQGMTDAVESQKRTQITSDYISQLDQLAKLTGKSRDTLAKEMKQKAQDAQFSATLMDMDAEQAAAAKAQLAFVENTYGKDASDLFKARMAGVVPTGDGARKLMATSLGSTLSDMAQQTAQTSGAAAGGILSSFHGELGAAAKETRDMLRPLALAGGLVSSSFGNLFSATNQATLKNQAILDAMGLEITAMDKLTDAMSKMYNSTLGKKEDGTLKPEAKALQERARLEHISELAARMVHQIITGKGRQGQQVGSGAGFTAAEEGTWAVNEAIEVIGNFKTWGPAIGGGTEGGGYGANWYGYGDWAPNTNVGAVSGAGVDYTGVGATSSTEDLIKRITGVEGASRAILASSENEKGVLDALIKQGVDAGQAISVVSKIKMQETMAQTGMTQKNIQMQLRRGGGSLRDLSEVNQNTQIETTMKKNNAVEDGKAWNSSVTDLLTKMLELMKTGKSLNINGEEVKIGPKAAAGSISTKEAIAGGQDYAF